MDEPLSDTYPVRDPERTLDLAKSRSAANRLATTLINKGKDFHVRLVDLNGADAWEFSIEETNSPSRFEV